MFSNALDTGCSEARYFRGKLIRGRWQAVSLSAGVLQGSMLSIMVVWVPNSRDG